MWLSESGGFRSLADWQVFDEDGALLDVDDHPIRKAARTRKPIRNKLVNVRQPRSGDLVWMKITGGSLLENIMLNL